MYVAISAISVLKSACFKTVSRQPSRAFSDEQFHNELQLKNNLVQMKQHDVTGLSTRRKQRRTKQNAINYLNKNGDTF